MRPTIAQRPLKVIIYIQCDATRNRCLQQLGELQAGTQLATQLARYALEWVKCNNEEEVVATLRAHFGASPSNAALLLSDQLVETFGQFPEERYVLKSWLKANVLDEFEGRLLGTVAIMPRNVRVPDIDRVLWKTFDATALLEVLSLLASKLTYLAPPERSAASVGLGPVVVRPITRKEELVDYFKLRHRIYRVMGYLEPRVDLASSKMEIDEGDTHALHFGAFVREGVRDRLVGTARVVCLELEEDENARWTRSLAKADTALGWSTGLHLQLRLPIFQSMIGLDDRLIQVLTEEQNCGELSRVIVAEDYRGLGLSELLVWFALLQADRKKVNRLLLECLPVHERLYRKFGFQVLPGVQGQVTGVGKTMIAMELEQGTLEQFRGQPPAIRFAQVLRQRGQLLSCFTPACGSAECELYVNGRCAVR